MDRAERTARLADEGWVLPWGLGRQVDPGSAAFVPRLAGEGITNRTGRRWTPIGPAGGPAGFVDPAGLVTPRIGGWSVDWWVGADDRWRLPSREPAVRQSLMGSSPVVETALRVPGGDAVHRCYGVPGAFVIEVENRSPSPFALALSVRPLDPLGATAVGTVAVEGREVLVDGRPRLILPDRAGRAATSTGASGDVAGVVLSGRADLTAGPASCPDGLASAAVLMAVAHRATVRVVLPGAGAVAPVDDLPSADAVVRGWQAHGRTGLQAEVPDPVLQRAFDASRRSLLLLDGDDPGPAGEGALVAAALARLGRHAEADDLVRALWSRQRTDGSFDEPAGGGAPGGAHLWALGEHLRLRPDLELATALDRGMVAAEGWLRELDASGRLSAPARRWSVAGRRAAGLAGGGAGEAGLAVAAAALLTPPAGGRDGDGPDVSPTASAALSLGRPPGPAGPGGDARPAVTGPTGSDVPATLAAAAAELAEGDPAALGRLAWLLAVGDPTWSWPDHVHPRTGAGSVGRGSSPLATAGFLLVVRDLLVTEPAPGHALLVPVLPEGWRGQPLEVHDAVLSGGVRLSFAVRWHGPRPALLWEASGPLRLTAPGLDPSFTSPEPRGEVLLDGPASPESAEGGTVELS